MANDGVDFDLRPGEVHALLGENGAGKSTLMNILYGLATPDEGEILMEGERVAIASPRDAIDRGIGMVHQHFMLIPVMTVAENVVLGTEPTRRGRLDLEGAEARVRELSERFGLAVRPEAVVETTSVGQQQRVEILKALYRDARVLILDEPTAVLTPQEAGELFVTIRSLRDAGTAIVFITHKLGEVLDVADRITVLRAGRTIETVAREGATQEGLARLMVGRDVLLRVEKGPAVPGEPLLEVQGLAVEDQRGLPAVRDVSFTVRAGEIVGVAGVDGNGQSELIDAICGLATPAPGGSSWAGARWRARAAVSASTRASATSPRTVSAAVSCSTSRSPRTSPCTTTTTRPTRASDGSRRAGCSPGPGACSASGTCAAAGRAPLHSRSRGATSRRW